MLHSKGRLPGEKKPMKNNNNIEMKEHPVSPVLLNHKTGALVSLIETVTMLQICLCSTFWTQHKPYAKSRFSIIRAFEKTSMLQAAIEQYEERYPEREVKVMSRKAQRASCSSCESETQALWDAIRECVWSQKKLRCSAVIQPMGGGGSRTYIPTFLARKTS